MEKPNVIGAFESRPNLKNRVTKIEEGIYAIGICDSWDDLFASLFLAVNDHNYRPEKVKEIERFNCGECGDENIFFSGKYLPIRVWGTEAQLVQGTFYRERKDGREGKDGRTAWPVLGLPFLVIYLLIGPLIPE